MALRPLPHFLLRAPLLPIDAIGRSPRAIFREPLARAALALASPGLASGRETKESARALANFARRAAFRPTPHGLWAGVAVGRLGARTRLDTGAPRAQLTVSWARLAALGRALLDDPGEREQTRLRVAPSLFASGERAMWLAFGEETEAEARSAEIDPALARVIEAARDWRRFGEVRAALAELERGDDGELDDYLLALVDDGLLVHDLEPPLVGPPPLDWMRARLAGRLPALDEAAAQLASLQEPLGEMSANEARAALGEIEARLAALPGAGPSPIHALLLHQPRGEMILSQKAVERAAELAAILFRLQEALAPPAAERGQNGGVAEALDAVTEIFGAGALDLDALALGDYGSALDRPIDPDRPPPPAELLAFFVDALLAAQGDVLALSSEQLAPLLPAAETPPTFELFLAPARESRGAVSGTGWLLGLHAPAGATWGRFAHAQPQVAGALHELARAERAARPDETHLDVAYAPARALGDLAAHPPIRSAALALSSWPDGEAVAPAALELCADPAAPIPLALRVQDHPVAPSPLERLRGTTAPPGVYRLLAGYSLYRQHAPWALQLGPLADLARLPRITLDGFVISPASWRLPGKLDAPAIRRWRRALEVPRRVQIGHEDELLLVDLDDPAQAALLGRIDPATRPRVWEVWPPFDETIDRAGRRVEAVVAVVDVPDDPERARFEAQSIVRAGRVAPPRAQPHDSGWCTLKLFGAPDRADRVLVAAADPVRAARAAGAIDRWFFLRYVDGPGRREHLRLRWHASDRDAADRLAAQVEGALDEARAAGDLVSIERADYHRELARYGARAIDTVERLFEADSELACALLGGEETDADLIELSVRSFDALATGLGLDPAARRALARRRRLAHAGELAALGAGTKRDPLAAEHRARQERLYRALTSLPQTSPFAGYRATVARERSTLDDAQRDALLPALLHLASVRLLGPDRLEEARVYYLWERALDSVIGRISR